MIDLSNRIEDNLESKKLNTNLEKTLDTNTNSEIIGTNEKEFYTNSHSENIIFDENQKSINLLNPNTNLDTTTSLSNILSDSEQDADVSSTDISSDTIQNNTNNDSTNIAESQEQDTNVVNCLALTVKKDYNLSIVKNVVVKTFKNFWKIAVSIFTLNLLKFFM